MIVEHLQRDLASTQILDAHVVILNNYVRRHHVASYSELAKRVRKLTVLLSTPMEPDRDWEAQWDGLDVRVQKNVMFRASWKHSTGFKEANFIHIPIDTQKQLKALNPDIVFSYEMGMRTLFSSWYRRKTGVPLVMVGNMSEFIERERGLIRNSLRKIICRGVDHFTYNGPSCKRYLMSLGIPSSQLYHLPYCINEEVVFRGHREYPQEGLKRLLYCGAISSRKGILEFTRALQSWCSENFDGNPSRPRIELSIAGTGGLRDEVGQLATGRLKINFLGNLGAAELRDAYGSNDICVFPTFADEWGLVPIEAMASGMPVIGSQLAQSVEANIRSGENGWSFDPTESSSMIKAIDSALMTSPDRLLEMGQIARRSVQHISASATADCFKQIIESVAPDIKIMNPK